MNQTISRQFTLASRPVGLPVSSDWDLITKPLNDPGDEQLLIQVKYVALDPGFRSILNEGTSQSATLPIGTVMPAFFVGQVLKSNHSDYVPGDFVYGQGGVQDYLISNVEGLIKVDPSLGPLPMFLNLLGTTGMAAYFGLLRSGQPKPGETVVVSAAAGAVGSVVGQIAVIKGARAIGIAGGAQKCEYLKKIGFDGAIDYKSDDVQAKLREFCPNGVDIYFDNVGGEMLDLLLTQIRVGARIVMCGAISQYNSVEPISGLKNYLMLLAKRARIEGILFADYSSEFELATKDLLMWYSQGHITTKEHIVEGLEAFPTAFQKLFSGGNFGKLILQI
ncbi:MAG: NADP-dependent oxidoreductase [Cyanobacteria bacterium P01_E01_bin.6]